MAMKSDKRSCGSSHHYIYEPHYCALQGAQHPAPLQKKSPHSSILDISQQKMSLGKGGGD
jgi:hypothetical protein